MSVVKRVQIKMRIQEPDQNFVMATQTHKTTKKPASKPRPKTKASIKAVVTSKRKKAGSATSAPLSLNAVDAWMRKRKEAIAAQAKKNGLKLFGKEIL
jgi:hypothetical protein